MTEQCQRAQREATKRLLWKGDARIIIEQKAKESIIEQPQRAEGGVVREHLQKAGEAMKEQSQRAEGLTMLRHSQQRWTATMQVYIYSERTFPLPCLPFLKLETAIRLEGCKCPASPLVPRRSLSRYGSRAIFCQNKILTLTKVFIQYELSLTFPIFLQYILASLCKLSQLPAEAMHGSIQRRESQIMKSLVYGR